MKSGFERPMKRDSRDVELPLLTTALAPSELAPVATFPSRFARTVWGSSDSS